MRHREMLLAVMDAMRSDLERFLTDHREDSEQQIGGGWSLHDVVAHLALWDRMAVRRIVGTPLPEGDEVASREPWDLDAFNDEMRLRMATRPMSEVAAEFDAAWQAVRLAVATADDDACRRGGRVWTIVNDDSAGHYPRHIPIRDRLAEQPGT